MRFSFARLILCNVIGYPLAEVSLVDGPILAFHGDNGAGKTSLLAMAMAVLVPDARKIDHAVRGGSTTKSGLVGRVCLHRAPSYAILELRRGQNSLHIGVQFREGPGALPNVIPFVVEGLSAGVPATEWLIKPAVAGHAGAVAILDEVRQAVGLLGGRLADYSREQDYYERLDELGILPSSLSTRAEREQWANIFLFGFGRRPHDIVAGLKDYLLAEDDTLRRSVETIDESFRSVVDCQKRISRYRTHAEALAVLWDRTSRLIASAGASTRAEHERIKEDADRVTTEIRRIQVNLEATGLQIVSAASETDRLARAMNEAKTTQMEAHRKAVTRDNQLTSEVEHATQAATRLDTLRQLRQKLKRPLRDSAEVTAVRGALERRRHRITRTKERLLATLPELALARPRSGIKSGSLRDLDELKLAAMSEDPRVSELDDTSASKIQAALGPAVRALVATNPAVTALELLANYKVPHDLWLISPESVEAVLKSAISATGPTGAVVEEGEFLRASPLPAFPILGAGARQREAMRSAQIQRLLPILDASDAAAEGLLEMAISLTGASQAVFDAELDMVVEAKTRSQAFATGLASIEQSASFEPDDEKLDSNDRRILNGLRAATHSLEIATNAYTKHAQITAIAQRDKDHNEAALADLRQRSTSLNIELAELATNRATWAAALGEDATLADLLSDERYKELNAKFGDRAATNSRHAAQNALMEVARLAESSQHLAKLAADNGIELSVLAEAAADLAPTALLALWKNVKALALVLVPDDLVAATGDPSRDLRLLMEGVARVEEQLAEAEATFRDRASRLEPNILGAVSRSSLRLERLSRANGAGSFGSFDDVRLKVVKSEPMLAALQAITNREDDLLFTGERLQDALARIIEAIESERGESLGLPASKVLDYRTYASVRVEVKRRGAPDWQLLSTTGASNGEEIGVSFVALCMILEEWEQRRAAFTGNRVATCFRLLILDEATQVDDHGLGTIAAFAQDLGATVILASPKVVRVVGRSTVYSLVGDATSTDSRVKMTLLSGRVVDEPALQITSDQESQSG